jgi:seryl-tRNA synthetase
MLDIKFILENKEQVKKAVTDKGLQLDVEKLALVYARRNELLEEMEKLQGEKNKINDEIISALDKEALIKNGKEIKEKISQLEPELKEFQTALNEMLVLVPNIPASDVPIGKSEKDNVEIYKWGEIPKFSFKIKDHVQLGRELDILDLERGVKVGGYRGYYVKNEGASLMMACMLYALHKMIEKGYAPMLVPTLVKEFALFGSGYFKGLEYNPEVDEIYQVATSDKEADGKISKDKKFLVGTAEPSLLAYYSGEVLREEDLPIKMCGYSQCYRSEIGSYGKDTKGLYRVHEFMKVEQVVLSKADIPESDKLQEEMVAIAKEMHEELGLPYRQLKICTGDMGVGKYKMFDIEAWIPSRENYGETGSASNFLDWQARRLNVKYVDKKGEKKYVYMLNNTALPSPRIFIALLENYQQKDGSVEIPKVLQKYMPKGMKKISPKK